MTSVLMIGSLAVGTANAVLAAILLFVYRGVYARTKAPFSLALILFAAAFLAQNLLMVYSLGTMMDLVPGGLAGEELILATVLAIILVLVILRSAIKVVREYERLVVFRLGRLLHKPKGPGLTWIIPIFDRRVLIDLRVVAFDVPRQRVVTRDNVSVEVDAVVYYRVYDPLKAVTEVQNYIQATNLLAQTTLRDVLGQVELDELLSKREELSKRIQVLLDIATEPWGIKVSAVTLRDVSLPDTMVRAIAKQAEAERERRSRVIMAEGEAQAAEKMREAAMLYGSAPSAMRLRELQTLTEIAREKNMIVVTNTTAAGDITGEVASLTAAFAKKGGEKK